MKQFKKKWLQRISEEPVPQKGFDRRVFLRRSTPEQRRELRCRDSDSRPARVTGFAVPKRIRKQAFDLALASVLRFLLAAHGRSSRRHGTRGDADRKQDRRARKRQVVG